MSYYVEKLSSLVKYSSSTSVTVPMVLPVLPFSGDSI